MSGQAVRRKPEPKFPEIARGGFSSSSLSAEMHHYERSSGNQTAR